MYFCNVRASFRANDNNTFTLLQEDSYYPFGMQQPSMSYLSRGTEHKNLHLYNGKELQEDFDLNWYDYGARFYDVELVRWHVVDPLAESAYSWTPYRYGFNNPIKYIDPNGLFETVKPTGDEALKMIKNTLTSKDAKYIKLDKNGNIDRKLINSHTSESGNYNSLKEMVNSDKVVEVSTAEQFNFVDENGKQGNVRMNYSPQDPQFPNEVDSNGDTMSGTTTGEAGFMGKTLFPDRDGKQNSPDKTIKVIIHKKLSEPAKAEMYSHEANGHALLYIRNGGDHKGASHQSVKGKWVEGNKQLKEMIIRSKKETIENMKK